MDHVQARILVETLGIEQETIASELGKTPRQVSRWLAGHTPIPFDFEEWLLERWQLFVNALADATEEYDEGKTAPVPVWADQESLLAEGVSVSLSESRALSRALLILAGVSNFKKRNCEWNTSI